MISHPGDGATSARSMVNTVLAGSGSAAVALILSAGRAFPAQWPFSFTINAVLSGMVAICAGADVYSFWAAFLVGAVATCIYWAVHNFVLTLCVDDPLDTAAVHLGAGMWGVLARPLLEPEGVFYTFSSHAFSKLGRNALGGAVIMLWAAGTSAVLFGALRAFNLFRVSPQEEALGLDESKHGEVSYPIEAWHWNISTTKANTSSTVNNGFTQDKADKFVKQDFENLGFEMEKHG